MSIYRTGAGLARSADGKLGRCCCEPTCIEWGGYLLLNDTPQFGGSNNYVPPIEVHPPNVPDDTVGSLPTCIRSLVWKSLTWDAGAGFPLEWVVVGGMSVPDFILRNAKYCSRATGILSERVESYPVVSPCWDLNPATGLGSFDFSDLTIASGFMDGLFPAEIKAALASYPGSFTMALTCDTYTNCTKRGPSLYFDSWGSTSHIKFTASAYFPTEAQAEAIAAATLDQSCF